MSHVMCVKKIVYLSAMAPKVSPELLVEHQGELGLWKSTKKGREFDVLLNFSFNVTTKSGLGWTAREQSSVMWFESLKKKRSLLLQPLPLVCISPNKSSAGHILDKSELVHPSHFANVSKTAWGLYMSSHHELDYIPGTWRFGAQTASEATKIQISQRRAMFHFSRRSFHS